MEMLLLVQGLGICQKGHLLVCAACYLIFLSLSRSSRSFVSNADDVSWLKRPSLWSFCLFRNQSGILNVRGLETMTMSSSSSFALSSPALFQRKVQSGLLITELSTTKLVCIQLMLACQLEFACRPFLEVNLSLLAHNVGKSPSKTLDGGHGVHDVLLAVNIGVENTQNMLKVVCSYQGLQNPGKRSAKL